jgi:hypothetical protein
MQMRFLSADSLAGMVPNRSTTRAVKSLDPIFLRVTVLPGAQREAAVAHLLGFPLLPPRI